MGIRFRSYICGLSEDECECIARFDLQHALQFKKGGFITIHHNQIQNITAKLSKEVCKYICVEHHLQRLTGETLLSSTLTENKVDLDICARDFWQTDRSATFFDASFFSPNTKRYANQDISKIFELNEKEKKRLYIERIIEIEHVHFTLLMMSATGRMSR